MTVSGLGTSHTPFPLLAPAARPVDRPERPRSGFEQLTGADRALIQHVTGQRIGPGFDPAAQPATAFATALAAERATGRLAPGQEVTAVYLKDLDRRLARIGRNPIGPHLDKAVGYLQGAGGPSHFDVSA
jgi:hypothetical protein